MINDYSFLQTKNEYLIHQFSITALASKLWIKAIKVNVHAIYVSYLS